MTSLSEVVDSLAAATLHTYELSNVEIDKTKALVQLQIDIKKHFKNINIAAFKEKRWRELQVSGTQPEDYTERLIFIGNAKCLMAGIRHFGMDSELPFIDICPNFPICSRAEAIQVFDQISPYFSAFDPKMVRLYRPTKMDAQINSIFMVQGARKIQELPHWAQQHEIALQKVEDDSYYDWYQKGYRLFHERSPQLRESVPINSLSVMETSRKQGLLFYMLKDGLRSGLIAAERLPFLGHSGFFFNDIFISSDFVGRGLGKVLQKQIIDQHCSVKDIVWGTIDASNISSIKTASYNGRLPLRYECFLSIKEKTRRFY